MPAPRIALIVGNGLSLDFRRAVGDPLFEWDTSLPLGWDVRDPGAPDQQILTVLPRLTKFLQDARQMQPDGADYEHLALLPMLYQYSGPEDNAAFELIVEARHFLNLAYSSFQRVADTTSLDTWAWKKWVVTHASELTCAVSLNYDLVLERLLAAAKIRVRGFGIVGEDRGLPLLKPHGSIDFDASKQEISIGPITYPLTTWLTLNNTPLRRLTAAETMEARTDVNIVLPGQASGVQGFQWVQSGYAHFRSLAPTWSDCVVVGISYWDCDRVELDYLIDSFRLGTRIHVVDPHPAPQLCEAVVTRGLKLLVSDGPPTL